MKISNNKGMAAVAPAIAVTDEGKVAFALIAGALTAVKAIWASLIGGRSPLELRGGEVPRYGKTVYGESGPSATYLTERYTLTEGLHQWLVMLEPLVDAPYYLLLPTGATPQETLISVLDRHTLWPVRGAWSETLWELGQKEGLVQVMKTYGTLPWAYQVAPFRWDEVIDAGAKAGTLVI